MTEAPTQHLRVLIANQDRDRLDTLAEVVVELGHRVVAAETAIDEVAAATVRERPDVALVALGESSGHALGLIRKIVAEAECPVITLVGTYDRDFVSEAARAGVFSYIVDSDSDALRSSLEIVLLRFADFHGLEGAFGRRAITERAKGIVMERYGVDEQQAFERLRQRARNTNKKLIDVAQDVIAGRVLRPPR